MADLARLGMVFDVQGADKANKALDDVAAKSGKAEQAVDSLGQAQKKAGTAADKTAQDIANLSRAQQDAAKASQSMAAQVDAAAQAAARQAAELRKTSAAHDTLAKSARGVADSHDKVAKSVGAAGQAVGTAARDIATGGDAMGALGRAGLDVAKAMPVVGGVIGVVAAVAAGLGLALYKGAEDARAFSNAMKATGDAAGITGDQFQSMVMSLGTIKGGFDGFADARAALLALAESGKVSGDELQALGEVALRLSDLTGQSATTIASQWANMGDDVTAFAIKVNEQYHLITEAQYEHIKLLQDEGKTAQAQYALISDAQATLAARGKSDLGILERAWRGVGSAIAGAWEQLKKFGAGGDIGLQNNISSIQATLKSGVAPGSGFGGAPARPLSARERADYQSELTALQSTLAAHQQVAKSAAEQTAAETAGIDAAQRHASIYATMGDNLKKVNAEIAKYRADQEAIRKVNPKSAELDSPSRAAKIEADIRKKYTESLRGPKAPKGPSDRSDSALDAADKAELAAQLALTKDVEQIAALKHQQVANELKSQQDQLARQVKDKSVNASTAEIASGKYAEAARLKDQAIDQEKELALSAADLAQRQAISGFRDRQAAAEAQLASSAAEANKFTQDALDRRQKLEADTLDQKLKQQVQTQAITTAQAKEQKAALKDAQASEQQVAAKQAALKASKEALDLEDARTNAQVDLLKAQEAASQTEISRHAFEVQILLLQQQQERERLEAITELNGYTAQEVAIAKERLKVLPDIQAAEKDQLKNQRKLLDSFNEAKGWLDGLGDAFKSHDWANVAGKLADAISKTIEVLSNAKASLADKISTVAGVASSIGGMIGGKAGGFISGAASGAAGGAQLGTMIAPGIGTAIGAVAGGIFGGLSSLFGGGETRQQRRDRENQAAQDEAQRAQTIANQKRDLELQLIELSGDKIASLAAQRDHELSSIDASNQALQKQVYEAQDREARRQQVQSAEITYLQLAGKNLDALNVQRAEEIKNIDAAIQPLQRLVYAAQDAADALSTAGDNLSKAKSDLESAYSTELSRLQGNVSSAHDALAAAYDKESSALQDVINTSQEAAKSLRDYRKSLDTSTTGLSPENAYRQTKAQFEDIARRAQLGDAQAQQDFAGAGEAFRSASQSYNGLSPAYLNDISAIKSATDAAAATADRTADNATKQLDALKELVAGYLDLNDNTVSIDQEIKDLVTAKDALAHTQSIVEPLLGINNGVLNLNMAIMSYQLAMVRYAEAQEANNAAIQALAGAVAAAKADPNNQPQPATGVSTTQGYRSTNGDYAAYVDGNPDLLAAYNAGTGIAKGRTKAEFGLYQWSIAGKNEPRQVRPFAHGGEFMVGGSGGTDSQHVNFLASPDEHVAVKTPQQMARETAALERLAAAQEETNERLGQVVVELKADKTQRGAQTRILSEGFAGLGDSFETGQRRAKGVR